MLTFVCWKWKRPAFGFQLPAAIADYGARHVNTLASMLRRNVRLPHRLVCLTDDPKGLACETAPVPNKWAELGGCYRRLWLFSDEAKTLGDRLVSIDLDCVMVRDCTPLFERPEDFVCNRYQGQARDPDQRYNGGMFMLTAGARRQVWDTFDLSAAREVARARDARQVVGSDQAWLRLCLGPNEATWGPEHGIYEARAVRYDPPRDARLVFYAGKRDPSLDRRDWVRQAWQ